MRQERSYIQPSCILQVWWEGDDRLVIQQLGFILRFNDQQTIAGDLGQLWGLINGIEAYIQRFLSRDYLPTTVHSVMGLRLSAGQLVDASNAIEELRKEVLLLPTSPSVKDDWAWVKSVMVAGVALTVGAGMGLWLASRQSRMTPSVVVAPPPEVFTDNPPPQNLPKEAVKVPVPKQTTKETLPPITVYSRPPAPPPLEKISPPPPPIPEEAPPETRELPEVVSSGEDIEKAARTITIESVEISTSPVLTEDLINYLGSLSLPEGKITIDVTVEGGVILTTGIENNSADNNATWLSLLEGWKPPEQSGRVRLQVSVP